MKQKEIKFRVWEEEYKSMNYLGYTSGEFIIAFDDEQIYLIDNNDGDGRDITKSAVLMQYTDLKDKNGKEIWEGDIVKDNSTKFLIARNLFHSNLGIVDLPLQEQWEGISTDLEKMEVIGNKFKNPELLSNKKELKL